MVRRRRSIVDVLLVCFTAGDVHTSTGSHGGSPSQVKLMNLATLHALCKQEKSNYVAFITTGEIHIKKSVRGACEISKIVKHVRERELGNPVLVLALSYSGSPRT